MALVGTTLPVSAPLPLTAQRRVEGLVRQGHYAVSDAARYLDRAINTVSASRMKVLFCNSWKDDDHSGTSTDDYTIFARTGATMRRVHSHVVIQPLDTFNTTDDHYAQWLISPTDASGDKDQDKIQIEAVNTGSFGPGEYIHLKQTWGDLDRDKEYSFKFQLNAYARFVSISVYEQQNVQSPVYTTPLASINPRHSAVSGQIYTQQVEDWWTSQENLWKLNGATFFSASKIGSTSGKLASTSSATNVNIYDATFTAFNAAAPGHYVIANNKGSIDDSEVPCRFWAYARASSPGTGDGTIELHDSSGVLGTLTINSGTAQFWSTDITIPASTQKLDVLFRKAGSGLTFIDQVGLYEYES